MKPDSLNTGKEIAHSCVSNTSSQARVRCKCCLVGFGETAENSCPDRSVHRRLWVTTVGWAATNLQNIYPKQDSCLNIPLFPLRSAFVSLSLAVLALEICFLEMVKHLWLTYCQTYCFPVFLQPMLEECRHVGKSIFSKSFRKTR